MTDKIIQISTCYKGDQYEQEWCVYGLSENGNLYWQNQYGFWKLESKSPDLEEPK